MSFFRIWKSGIFVAICSWFHPFLSNCLRMRAFWKKVFKNLFLELGRKMWFSEKRQKLLYFDKALWPNHLTYSKPLGISGKTMSISFIWYPGIWNLSSHWVTVALWKWWPLKGSGRKWVIRPYPLACPCMTLQVKRGLIQFTNETSLSQYSNNGTQYTLGRPDLDLFEAHYFLALLGHN